MNAARARRRWLAWGRYVAATNTCGKPRQAHIHNGHAKAYQDAMFARRYPPRGARVVYYPRWMARG